MERAGAAVFSPITGIVISFLVVRAGNGAQCCSSPPPSIESYYAFEARDTKEKNRPDRRGVYISKAGPGRFLSALNLSEQVSTTDDTDDTDVLTERAENIRGRK